MDKKKYMVLCIYQLLSIAFMILIVVTKDTIYEVMLNPLYYQNYFEELFIQIFLILNAMFVLFVALDHDHQFFKPFISYFRREKVFTAKYIFFSITILFFFSYISMLYIVLPALVTGLKMTYKTLMMVELVLDMFIILNFICILIKEKYKTLAVIIVLVYILAILFIPQTNEVLFYLLPIMRIEKETNMIEILYKICYICLGFTIYLLKSLKDDL